MAHDEHKAVAPTRVGCVVLTASDTRTPETDESGRLMRELLTEAGHPVVEARILKDEPSLIAAYIREKIVDPNVAVVLINGGTGLARRDSTFEAIDGMLEKRMPGFGELFRYLSYLDIGSSAMLSRATAGVVNGRVVMSVPGSPSAVRLAMEKLILPELGHLVWAAAPDRPPAAGLHSGMSHGHEHGASPSESRSSTHSHTHESAHGHDHGHGHSHSHKKTHGH